MSNNRLRNWNGYSRRGQAAYDQQFEQEMREAEQGNPFTYMSDEWFEHEIAKDEARAKKALASK